MPRKGEKMNEKQKQKISDSHFGIRLSVETRKKISSSKKGKKMPPKFGEAIRKRALGNKYALGTKRTIEHRIRIKDRTPRGDKHWNWKGGIKPLHQKIRHSQEYTIWRELVFQRDGYRCVECGDDKGGNLNADHIKPFAYFPELRFELTNGRTLCSPCHKKTDTWGKGAMKYSRAVLIKK